MQQGISYVGPQESVLGRGQAAGYAHGIVQNLEPAGFQKAFWWWCHVAKRWTPSHLATCEAAQCILQLGLLRLGPKYDRYAMHRPLAHCCLPH